MKPAESVLPSEGRSASWFLSTLGEAQSGHAGELEAGTLPKARIKISDVRSRFGCVG